MLIGWATLRGCNAGTASGNSIAVLVSLQRCGAVLVWLSILKGSISLSSPVLWTVIRKARPENGLV